MPIIVKVFAVEPSCLPLKRYINITIEYMSANRVLINQYLFIAFSGAFVIIAVTVMQILLMHKDLAHKLSQGEHYENTDAN